MRRIAIGALLLLAASARVRGEAAKTPAPAGGAAIAILEPEVVGEISDTQRKNLAAGVDAVLADGFAKQQGLQLIERGALDEVLGERRMQMAIGDVPQALRPLWSAGVMICTRVEVKSGAVVVEAVSAQTGQLIASLGLKVKGGEDPAKALAGKVEAFAAGLPAAIKAAEKKPLLEISGKLSGGLNRLAWMMDDFTQEAGVRVSTLATVGWLVPRQPLVTKEERLLRVMGLAEAKPGDEAAGWSPVPAMRLTFEVVDSAKVGAVFEKTPLTLKLSLRRQDGKTAETAIAGEVGKWEECRGKGVSWLMGQLGGEAATAEGGDEAAAAKLAQEEISMVSQWAGLSEYDREEAGTPIRARVAEHALRAAHLDPTNEEAAYLVVCCVDALYPRQGKDQTTYSFASLDRTILEAQRFLERFPKATVKHRMEVLHVLGTAGVKGSWETINRRVRDPYLHSPEVKGYPYTSAYVRAWADEGYLGAMDKRYSEGNAISAFSFNLMYTLIPCIPAEKLEEEQEYWRDFYATKIAAVLRKTSPHDFLNTRPAPWELIEAGFQARLKHPEAVREALQKLALEVPKSERSIWGGDEYRPATVGQLLQAAGEKDWKTWEPAFKAAEPVKVTIAAMTALMRSLSPKLTPVWDGDLLLAMKGQELKIPQAVRAASAEPGNTMSGTMQALLIAGGDLWIRTPAELPGNSGGGFRLLAVKLDANGDTTDSVQVIKWPEANKIEGSPEFKVHYVTQEKDGDCVWLGTLHHGLARFEKKDGVWQGRWYNDKNGAPSNGVSGITSCVNKGQRELLVLDRTYRRSFQKGKSKYQGDTFMLWSLNPATGQITLLHDGNEDTSYLYAPAAELADGRRVLLEAAGGGAYEKLLDVSDIRKIIGSKVGSGLGNIAPATVGDDGVRRLWAMPEGNTMQAYDPLTLTALKGAGPGKDSGRHVLAAVSRQAMEIMGMIAAWPGSDEYAAAPRWPVARYAVFTLGRGDVIWMAINNGGYWDDARELVGYRPAPAGSKEWSAEDAWIGPFKAFAGEQILSLEPDGAGKMLVSTRGHLLLLDSKELIAQAQKAKSVRSTNQWRADFQARAGKGSWQSVVPVLIAGGQFGEAERLLDDRTRELGDRAATDEERLRLLFWRARSYAGQKARIPEAIKVYEQAATRAGAGSAGEVFAWANEVFLLHQSGRWGETLALGAKMKATYVQTAEMGASGGVDWYMNDALRRLKAKSGTDAAPAAAGY